MYRQEAHPCLESLIAFILWLLWPIRKLGAKLGFWAFYELKIVYRVEHETNDSVDGHAILREGPYHRSLGGESIADYQQLTYNDHPTPHQEHLEFWMGQHYCAFPSQQQLENWFSPDVRRKLHEWGFVLRQYKAWVNVGDKQVSIDGNRPVVRLTTSSLLPCNE